MIEFHSVDREVPKIDSELFVFVLNRLVSNEDKELGDINLIVCSDEHLLEMNQAHLDHDYYTDIITFDYCEDNVVSGDLFISIDRVADNASSLGVDFFNEFARVCVHGVLHLCGYGDKEEEEIVAMRGKEDFYLQLFVSRET
jgi:rRNA maturation RNase YbeY